MPMTQEACEEGCDDLSERETVLIRLRDELRFEGARLESLRAAARDAGAYRRAARGAIVSPGYVLGLIISLPIIYVVTLVYTAVTR